MSAKRDLQLTDQMEHALIILCAIAENMASKSPTTAAAFGIDSPLIERIKGARRRLEKISPQYEQ